MLKIKDSVDLERLKNYGFSKITDAQWIKKEEQVCSDGKFNVKIVVNSSESSIQNEINFFIENPYFEFYDTKIILVGIFDAVYDLIENGLVEKVPYKNEDLTNIRSSFEELSKKLCEAQSMIDSIAQENTVKEINGDIFDLLENFQKKLSDINSIQRKVDELR